MNEQLSKLLLDARLSSGLTQREAGETIGVKGNTISDWERVRTEPDIDSYVALCETYEIDPFESLREIYGTPNGRFIPSREELELLRKMRDLDGEDTSLLSVINEKMVEKRA